MHISPRKRVKELRLVILTKVRISLHLAGLVAYS
jgi:hypothetical protein